MKKIYIIVHSVPTNIIFGAYQSKYDAEKMKKKLEKEHPNTSFTVLSTPFYFYKDN